MSSETPSFRRLLAWFVAHWTAELPMTLHVRGVEWERPGRILRGDGSGVTDPGGGSRLGSPRLAPQFRLRVYGDAWATEHAVRDGQVALGETYAAPMTATITWLDRNRHPLIARWLRLLGGAGGDWRTVTATVGLPEEYGEAITRDALTLAWKSYREEPTSRVA